MRWKRGGCSKKVYKTQFIGIFFFKFLHLSLRVLSKNKIASVFNFLKTTLLPTIRFFCFEGLKHILGREIYRRKLFWLQDTKIKKLSDWFLTLSETNSLFIRKRKRFRLVGTKNIYILAVFEEMFRLAIRVFGPVTGHQCCFASLRIKLSNLH